MSHEQLYFDTLKRIAKGYQSPERLRCNADKEYGVSYEEALVEHFTWYDPDVYYDSISLIEPARAVLANIAKD